MSEQILELDPLRNVAPEKVTTIHIMGICGTAMAAIAGMLKEDGYTISGSDNHIYPPMSDFLNQIGVQVFSGYRAENLGHQPDLVVVGNVITKINPEAQALAASRIPYLSMPQTLSRFYLSSRKSLVITGTHGKTTASSMLASALYDAAQDPTFMIGGILQKFNTNYRIGDGPFFVLEGDEYDTAFFDKESKFLHYQPEIAVITSLEFDHADIFDDLEAIKRSFRKFVALLPPHGLIIANFDDDNVKKVLKEAPCAIQSYGLEPNRDWQITSIRPSPDATVFDLVHENKRVSDLKINFAGRHNCMNAAAVFAIMNHLGIAIPAIKKGLQGFSGIKRRQEIRGIVKGITVIDDFAHHPTAVLETLHALKHAHPQNRLIAVFEPRTNTSRRAIFQQAYGEAFDYADICVIKEPFASENDLDGNYFSAAKLADDICMRGRKARAFNDTDEILHYLQETAIPGDVIAVLSNGGFDNIHERLLQALSKRCNESDNGITD
ncbi:MAG: UDP-N-acetylmuramate:L-alanyl-gamma-D-glutamyl-meso-diaminopimelate ligase [Deltaproteobacteria bacterium]|nr:UDP-N-acetylmuramate:L-alanyl-gamma-D-glutamyl-meso-diaminopimelate ligase [Deltaproteobacteria bacterium]